MRYNKLTYNGPAKSLAVRGVIFRKGTPVHLLDAELPGPLAELCGYGIVATIIETESQPNVAIVVNSGIGVVWVGNSAVKLTDYGRFVKNVARRDLPPGVAATLLQKGGFVQA